MVMNDLATGALVLASLKTAHDALKPLLGRLLGPAADELGAVLQDRARMYRLANQLKMLSKVQEMFRGAGIEPEAVPLRVLLPLLEGASLEDDENLSSKWAGLLAHAAHPEQREKVHPSFVRILGELSPKDALVLDALWQGTRDTPEERSTTLMPQQIMALGSGMTRLEAQIVSENLWRLRLCASGTTVLRVDSEGVGPDSEIALTFLGRSFLRACEPLPT